MPVVIYGVNLYPIESCGSSRLLEGKRVWTNS